MQQIVALSQRLPESNFMSEWLHVLLYTVQLAYMYVIHRWGGGGGASASADDEIRGCGVKNYPLAYRGEELFAVVSVLSEVDNAASEGYLPEYW